MVHYIRILFFLFVVSASSVQAFLVSVKHAGMAVAGTAYAQDAESGGINPALIPEVGTRLDVGLSIVRSRGRTTISNNIAPALAGGEPTNGTFFPFHNKKNFYNPHFGVVKNFCGKCEGLAIGLVAYNKGHVYTKYNQHFPLLGVGNLRSNLTQEIISPMIAYKPNRYFSVGLGLNIVVQKFYLHGLEKLTLTRPVTFSNDPDDVTNRGSDYSTGVCVSLGAKFNPFDWLSFGVCWQPEVRMKRFEKYEGFLAQRGKLNHPETWNFGMMLQPLDCVHLLFDVQVIRYSQVGSLHHPLEPNFTLGVFGNPNYKLGGSSGPGFGWGDATIYRVGADYIFNDCLTLRAGWRYGKTPFKGKNNGFNLATDEVVEQYVTGGATWKWNSCYEISFYAAYGLPRTQKGTGAIPRILGGGDIDLHQHQIACGLSLGRMF